MLVAKLGQGGHDRGAKIIATAFADIGGYGGGYGDSLRITSAGPLALRMDGNRLWHASGSWATTVR
jgi:hypothetical protein